MSYVRFGEGGSDVYIYHDIGGYVSCCFCALAPDAGFQAFDAQPMLDHLTAHRAAGHRVPPWLDGVLRGDWPKLIGGAR